MEKQCKLQDSDSTYRTSTINFFLVSFKQKTQSEWQYCLSNKKPVDNRHLSCLFFCFPVVCIVLPQCPFCDIFLLVSYPFLFSYLRSLSCTKNKTRRCESRCHNSIVLFTVDVRTRWNCRDYINADSLYDELSRCSLFTVIVSPFFNFIVTSSSQCHGEFVHCID